VGSGPRNEIAYPRHDLTTHSSVLVSKDTQIIEPEEPDSASTRPDAQNTCAARKLFTKEFIDRQQQSNLLTTPCLHRWRWANKDSSALPKNQQFFRNAMSEERPLAHARSTSAIRLSEIRLFLDLTSFATASACRSVA
jgi:hypothetical protein